MTDFSQYEIKDERRPTDFSQYEIKDQQNTEDPGAYLDTLAAKPSESFLSKLPRNILIGLAHAGRNVHNLPHDVVSLAELPRNLLPQSMLADRPLSSYLPNDTRDFSDVFGGNEANDTWMDKLIKGAVEYAPDLAGGRGLLKAGVSRLKGTHHLKEAERLAKESGELFSYPSHFVEEAENYLPKTHATREMIKASEEGSYPASFAMQSQMGKHQRALERSPMAAERLLSPQVGDLKQRMLEELHSIFESKGITEGSELLKKGINSYRRYMQLKNLAKKAGISASLMGVLGFGYNKGRKYLVD